MKKDYIEYSKRFDVFSSYFFNDKDLSEFDRDKKIVFIKSKKVSYSNIRMKLYYIWLTTFKSNMNVAIVSKDINEAITNMQDIKKLIRDLPENIKPKYITVRKDLIVFENNSSIRSLTSDSLDNKIRGLTFNSMALSNEDLSKYYDDVIPRLVNYIK